MENTTLTKQKPRSSVVALLTALSMILPLTLSMPDVASASLCDDVASSTGGFFSCGTETTSFTEFTGTLSAPDASQYAPGLSQNQDLRSFIKNVVNFALGFLGLIAVVIIIYGGFLYVTAAGNEEQAGKGKKAITYPLIGIIIILSSFALVNTVLLAGGGSDQGAGGGAAPSGTPGGDENARRRALFAYAGSMVQSVTRDFVTGYQNYTEINLDLQGLANVDFADNIQTPSDFKTILEQKRSILTNIISKAGALSQIAEQGRQAIVNLDKYIGVANTAITEMSKGEVDQSTGARVVLDILSGGLNELFVKYGEQVDYNEFMADIENEFGENGTLVQANKKDFAQAIAKSEDKLLVLYNLIKGAGISPDVDTQFKLVINTFNGYITPPLLSSPLAFAEAGNLTRFFMRIALAQGPQGSQGISTSITLAKEMGNQEVLQIVNYLSKLYDLVKDLQFVYTVITADRTEGNAPLLVNFDGLKSLDPNNQTIDASNDSDCGNKGCYQWDFGDGKSAKGVTQSNIYNSPGTYVVQLKIKAPKAGENQVQPADGIAIQTITVKPASSKIDLVAKVNNEEYPLSKYSGQQQVVNVDELPVTTKEAKDGIDFIASGTTVGSGNEAKKLIDAKAPASVHWDFGDKSLGTKNTKDGEPNDANLQASNVTYQNPGTYRVLFQVTDEKGQKDSKFVNITVSPIVARIKVSPSSTGELTQEFTFDGSSSSSDASKITTYTWTVKDSEDKTPKDKNGEELKVSSETDSFKWTFTKSGKYRIGLKVSDGAADSAEFVTYVYIKSKPSVAQYTYTSPDPTHPGVYVFDAAPSFDPDGYDGEILSYNWEVNPPNCSYYKWDTGKNAFETGAGKPCSALKDDPSTTKGYSKDNQRIKIKFNGKDKYTVRLDAQDITNDLGNSTPLEQELNVENILDVAWSGTDDGSPIVCLLGKSSADGKCAADDKNTKVNFAVLTEHGIGCEIDTGDGTKEQCEAIDPVTHIGTASHSYSQSGTYRVKVTVFDAEDNVNVITRKVFIGGGEAPIAALSVAKDGENIAVGDAAQILEGNRKTVFTFDASQSMNLDGSRRNLTYSWDFGDGTEKSTKKTVTHVFADASKEENTSSNPDYAYNVTLSVSDQETGKTSASKDGVKIHIKKEAPVISGLVAVPATSNTVTPVQVNVSAAGAGDADGKIVSYKWWYEQILPTPDDTPLGVQITAAPNATLTIGTKGEENEKHTFKFGVTVTDNEGKTFDSSLLNQSSIPTVEVTNGPNKAPVAKFSVDKTSVFVCSTPEKPEQCDVVNFSSSSTDPDKEGKIESYMWNFEGKGYTNPGDKDYDKANVSYIFTKPAKDGVQVRLKVRDNNGAESVSDPVKIFVDAKSVPPVAAFTSTQTDPGKKKIQFTSEGKSTADEANGAKLKSWAWDFDVTSDFNGDGKNDNDVQATDVNPTFEYANFGIYRAKLTVTDDQGGTSSVSNFVNVKAPVVTQTQQASAPLDARLTTTPPASVADGRVHLQGDTGNVTFDFTGSTGDIKTYIIDKNVYFDGNGNGVKDDDEDYKATKPGTWTTPFARNYGNIRVRLTVIDGTGKKDTVDKDIVFDAPPPPPSSPTPPPASGSTTTQTGTGTDGKNQLSAFVLAGYEVVDWQLLLVSVAGFGIFIASTLNKKKHDRPKSK